MESAILRKRVCTREDHTMIESLHLDAVAGLDPDTPVVMLNLMKFRARALDGNGSGWDAYCRYSAHTVKLLKQRGARIVWAGDVRAVALGADANGDWDYAALVWYPRPAAFADMMSSAEYAIGNAERENGTERHLILATREAYSRLSAPAPR
jgi:uncharacterized protein (DUF1330 family)